MIFLNIILTGLFSNRSFKISAFFRTIVVIDVIRFVQGPELIFLN